MRTFHRSPSGEAFETIIIAVALAVFMRAFVVQAYFIPSGSMIETLEPYDHILAEKVSPLVRAYRPGDIVIFNLDPHRRPSGIAAAAANEDPDHREYVKRIIGTGGDLVAFHGGKLYLNGIEKREPYVHISSALSDNASTDYALIIRGRNIGVVNGKLLVDGAPLARALPASVPASAVEDLKPTNFAKLKDGKIGIRELRVPKGMCYLLGDNRLESADSRYFGFVDAQRLEGRAMAIYWPLRRMTWID